MHRFLIVRRHYQERAFEDSRQACFLLYIYLWKQQLGMKDVYIWMSREGSLWVSVTKDHFTHKRDWEPVTGTLQALSLVEKAEPVQVRFTLRLRDQRSMWMQDGCKVYMDSYMASNGSCFMVTWTIFKNHLLEVGLTQNRETMALQSLTTVDLFYFNNVCGPTWIEIRWNSIWLRARSHMTSHYTWGSVTTLHDFGGVLRRPLDTFFWALTISLSRLLACVGS